MSETAITIRMAEEGDAEALLAIIRTLCGKNSHHL